MKPRPRVAVSAPTLREPYEGAERRRCCCGARGDDGVWPASSVPPGVSGSPLLLQPSVIRRSSRAPASLPTPAALLERIRLLKRAMLAVVTREALCIPPGLVERVGGPGPDPAPPPEPVPAPGHADMPRRERMGWALGMGAVAASSSGACVCAGTLLVLGPLSEVEPPSCWLEGEVEARDVMRLRERMRSMREVSDGLRGAPWEAARRLSVRRIVWSTSSSILSARGARP